MAIKIITSLIVFFNVLVLSQDLPFQISIAALSVLCISYFIKNKTIRLIFKIMLLILSMYLLRMQYKTLLVTECGVSFVLLLSALKFWELENENDHFNMFLILFLAECCIFLINPSFLIFLTGFLKMLFYFYYILKIRNYDIGLLNPKRLLILVTPSLCFALLLFYTFPRFTQGFINTNDLQYLMSGGSSQLRFNELGPLNLSKDPIFVVTGLEKSSLNFSLLYWKSSVFWQISNSYMSSSNLNLKKENFPANKDFKYQYDVNVSQNLKEFLPVIDGTSIINKSSLPYNSYEDGSFKLKSISRGKLDYSASSNYGDRIQLFNKLIERKSLHLNTKRIDEITKIYLTPEALLLDDNQRLSQLKSVFKNRGFSYSLSPPAYENLEDFLISGQSGYCTHFAFSFAYLARLYKIPSRVVMGYLGGEVNPYDNSLVIRELDGHAWTEVYLKSKGWVRVDPTSMVAPDRLRMSASDFNNSLEPYYSFFNIKITKDAFNFKILQNASFLISSLNSKLSSSIINFDREKQLQVLKSLSPKNLPIGWVFVVSLIFSLSAFFLIFYFIGRPNIHPAEKRYRNLLRKMRQLGLEKNESETASQFIERCKRLHPKETPLLESELELYIDTFYK